MGWTICTGIPIGAEAVGCSNCPRLVHVGDVIWHERLPVVRLLLCQPCGERLRGPATVPPEQVAGADGLIARFRARRNGAGHR